MLSVSISMAVEVYNWWDDVPDHLKTKEQLKQKGLTPTGEIQACVAYGQGRRARSYDLYDQSQTRAMPRRVETPKSLAAKERIQVAHNLTVRTYRRCRIILDSSAMLDSNQICVRCEQE